MPDCNTAIFLFLGIIVIFSFVLNLGEALFTVKEIQTTVKEYEGELFDCNFYPLICRFIISCYATVLGFVCILCSFFLISTNTNIILWEIILYILYISFGPVMSFLCFFLLYDYKNYGYSCDQDLNKVYNPVIWILMAFLCFIGLTVTVMVGAKTLIRSIGCITRSIWSDKLVSCLLCEGDDLYELINNQEEFARLREAQIRPQL